MARSLSAFFLGIAFLSIGCVPAHTLTESIFEQTGLVPVSTTDPGRANLYRTTHRGYPILFRAQMGDVWGRYGARLTAGEVGSAVGGILAYLTGQHRAISDHVVGSPFDRMLSRVIGQPISLLVVLDHGKPNVSRLDIVSSSSTIQPEDPLPERFALGWKPGAISSDDIALTNRLTANRNLVERLSNYRSHYIRVDAYGVTFAFAGSENEWSGLINENGGYLPLINSIFESLADIADAL